MEGSNAKGNGRMKMIFKGKLYNGKEWTLFDRVYRVALLEIRNEVSARVRMPGGRCLWVKLSCLTGETS